MGDLDLARRLVADPRWRWEPGVAFHENQTPGAGLYRDGRGRVQDGLDAVPHAATPDLSDPATVGVLLSWLPLRMRSPGTDDAIWPHGTGWRVRVDGGLHPGATLGEAVARALLSLPPEMPWGPR